MLSKDLLQQFEDNITRFDENIHAFENGEIDRQTFKGISGGFGSYAQKEQGYMLRLRLPGGHITKEKLKFLADKISEHQIPLLKLTTCQTIQFHDLSADSVPQLVRDALKVGIITHGGGGYKILIRTFPSHNHENCLDQHQVENGYYRFTLGIWWTSTYTIC